MIYISISDTCSIVLLVKWSVFEQKHRSNSTKCPVNKLKVATLTASFSPHDVIERCVEILVIMLNRLAKFYLIKPQRNMLRIAQRDGTRHGDICHQWHTGIGCDMVTYLADSILKIEDHIYILLHGYFLIDLSICPVKMNFPKRRRPKGKYMFTGHIQGSIQK